MKQKVSITVVSIVLGMFALAAIPATSFAAQGNGKRFDIPVWNQTLDSNKRFVVLTNMNSEAVLDNETGLVWQRSPIISIENWPTALSNCYSLNLGGRGGWRLPTIEEIRTLVDPNESSPALPDGHPFSNVQPSGIYWSATTDPGDGNFAYALNMSNGHLSSILKTNKSLVIRWCVRGGHGYDAY